MRVAAERNQVADFNALAFRARQCPHVRADQGLRQKDSVLVVKRALAVDFDPIQKFPLGDAVLQFFQRDAPS